MEAGTTYDGKGDNDVHRKANIWTSRYLSYEKTHTHKQNSKHRLMTAKKGGSYSW